MSHIAPIVGDNIIDFTYGQFDGDAKKIATVTPVANWETKYGKYGYGTNQYEGKSVYIDLHKNLQAWSDKNNLGMKSMAPPKRNHVK